MKLNPPNNLVFKGSANFIGRQHELTVLRDKLLRPGIVALTAVAGMGGVGKTELATQYVHQHETDYPGGICWLSARESNIAALIIQFAQLYMKLEVPQKDFRERMLSLTEQVAWCWQNWQPSQGLALIILDDVTDLGSCRDFLPGGNRFRVLMTTRLRILDSNIYEISLDVLSPEEALELLTKLVGEKRVQKEEETAKQLCEWLGYLPLGLELVGRYVAKKPPNNTLARMLQRLKDQRLEDEAINQQQLQQTLSTAQRGVLAAFELSWLKLDLITQRVAALLSLFTLDIFRWKWVESASSLLNWNSTDIDKAQEQLYNRHLIQLVEDTDSCYKIHPLIREFLKVKLATLEEAIELKRAFAETMVAIASSIPESLTQDFIESVKDVIPHLAEVAQNLIDAVSDKNLPWVFTGLGRYYEGQGLYALAQSWLEQCVSAVQSRLGEEHPHVAASYDNLAYLYHYQGRYSEAESLYNKALELEQRLLGSEHFFVANSYNNLAGVYRDQGRYSDAEPLYIKALSLRQRLLGKEHPHIALTLNNLALLYYYQERYSEAEPLSLQAIELDKQLLGEEHPDVATDIHNLALIYKAQERYSEAEPLFLQALELKQLLLPKNHPLLADTIYALGAMYIEQRRYDEAESLCLKALELDKQMLGEEHPKVATSLSNLAKLYKNQGRYAEAESLYIKALEIVEQSLGVNHPNTITVRNNLQSLRDHRTD